MKEEQEELDQLEKEPEQDDLIYLPAEGKIAEGVDQKIQMYYDTLNRSSSSSIDFQPNMINYFYQGIVENEEEREKITWLRKTFRNHRANLSDIAKHVRIVPTVLQLLKSPFYRTELLTQFTKWRKLRVDVIADKLSVDEKEIIENLMEGEPDIDQLKKEASKSEEAINILDPMLEKALNDLETTKEHVQKIKFGGILKNMLDLWTIEDIYQACIICTFWMCGQIKLKNTESEIEIEINCADYTPIDSANEPEEQANDMRNSYLVEMLDSFYNSETSNKNFSSAEMKTMIKLTFFWIMEINKSKQQYEKFKEASNPQNLNEDNIYKNMDMTKVERMTLESFIEEIDNVEDLCHNL